MKNVYVVYSKVRLKDTTLPIVLNVYKDYDKAKEYANKQCKKKERMLFF